MAAVSPAEAGRLTFRILGPLTAVRNGAEVRLAGARQKALLTYLLLHANRVVATERLIDELFGDEPPEHALNSVHAGISRLRRQLGGGAAGGPPIVTRPPGYLLDLAPGDLDLHEFEGLVEKGRRQLESGNAEAASQTLRDALGLWRGDPLTDLSAYAFAREEAARLEELRLATVAERIEADLALGRHGEVIRELEALVGAHPLRERLRAQLMLALYRSGRQADALQVYQETRRALVTELGLEPGKPLQRLEQQILTQDPELDLPISRRPAHEVAEPTVAVRRLRPLAAGTVGAVVLALVIAAVVIARRDRGPASLAAIAPNTVGVIDPNDGRLVAEIPVGQTPKGLAAGGGSVWVVNSGDSTLSRIDPARRVVLRTIPLPGAPSDAAVMGSVWVLHNRGSSSSDPFAGSASVTEVDPNFDNVARTIGVPAGFGNDFRDPLAVGPRGVWVAGPTGVSKIDAGSGNVHPRLTLTGVADLVASGGSVWAVRTDGSIARIDPSGDFVADTISLSSTSITIAAASAYESLWVIADPTRSGPQFGGPPMPQELQGGTASLFRVDPRDGEVTAKVRLEGRPVAVAAGHGGIWIADAEGQQVLRVDPDENRVVARIPLGALPTSIAADDNAVWVTVT
jgi:DNA-binding SARP family transcriptional activator/DNA-binding beta-propeller fold protein YncE